MAQRPKTPRPGCAFRDGALLFDVAEEDGTTSKVKEVKKGSEQNIYMYINHHLFDPPLKQA